MLGDLGDRYRRAMTNADFKARREIVENLVTQVTLYPSKAVVSGVIPIDNAVLGPPFPDLIVLHPHRFTDAPATRPQRHGAWGGGIGVDVSPGTPRTASEVERPRDQLHQ
jgi:hypothetical protein